MAEENPHRPRSIGWLQTYRVLFFGGGLDFILLAEGSILDRCCDVED